MVLWYGPHAHVRIVKKYPKVKKKLENINNWIYLGSISFYHDFLLWG